MATVKNNQTAANQKEAESVVKASMRVIATLTQELEEKKERKSFELLQERLNLQYALRQNSKSIAALNDMQQESHDCGCGGSKHKKVMIKNEPDAMVYVMDYLIFGLWLATFTLLGLSYFKKRNGN